MASLERTIKRKMKFSRMNKQQRILWSAQHGGINNPRKKALADTIMKLRRGVRND